MAGITLSGQSDAMEKISFGVSHLVGVECAVVHNRVAAKASLSTGHLIQLDCLMVVEEWSEVSDALALSPSLCSAPAPLRVFFPDMGGTVSTSNQS